MPTTLVGKIVEVLRMSFWSCFSIERSKTSLSIEEILAQIGDSFDDLRKTDGTKYKGDRTKALNGALFSTGIFRHTGSKWAIRQEELSQYQQRFQQKLESRNRKKKVAENGTGHPQKRKYTRRQIKRSAVVKMLNAASERLRKSSRDQNSVMFKNPFQVCEGDGVDI